MKRIAELRDLSDDHHTALVLAQRCRRAGVGDAHVVWGQVIELFESHLEPHFGIEEELLLPALEALGEPEMAARVREDHRSLRELRDAAPADHATLQRFGELLQAHVRYEEREVFETTQHRLPAEVLQRIQSACEQIPRVCSVRFEL